MKHEDYKRELMKDPKFRFWYYLIAPRYWIETIIIKIRIWLEESYEQKNK
jgi:hypothetical protein